MILCNIGKKIYVVIIKLTPIIGLYLFWICLHYIAAHLYAIYCTPYDILGFIASPFFISSIHCYSLRWIITNGGDIITKMWVILGLWITTFILPK